MARRRAAVLVCSLALGVAAAVAAVPAAVAGASGASRPHNSQSEACPAAPVRYARCLAKVLHPASRRHDPSPLSSTPVGYSPTAIAGAYGFARTGGAGSTIAIVDAYGDPTVTSNLQTFSSEYGIPCTGCFTKVNQTGRSSTYPRANSGWGLEQSLDVEWAHALAPSAHVLLVEARTNSFTNLLAAVRYAAASARYVSMSWGGTEFLGETSYDTYFKASGVSYFAAAGDTAGAVIYPSASPDVLSIGGTTLHSSGDAWVSETAWSDAGGGCSAYEPPSASQKAYPTYDQTTANCRTKRATPDISLDANPTTGVAVYDTEAESGWLEVGGTSASTVMVAAHATETGSPVGATFVYGKSIKVYDVTSGSNTHPCEVGYDLCTGVGSWNTAVGKTSGTSGGGGPTGTLSFTTTSKSLTAGGSVPVTVSASGASGSGSVSVSLSTNSSGGTFSPTSVTVPKGGSAAVDYKDTKAGTSTLTASATNWTSASRTVTVIPGSLHSISVTPSSTSLAEGATATFTARGYDSYGNPVTSGFSPTWTTTAPGTIASTGTATAKFTASSSKTGSGTVTASQGNGTAIVSGSASVTVEPLKALSVAVRTGQIKFHRGGYTVAIDVHVSSGGASVAGATATVSIYENSTCAGTPVTEPASATTGSGGTADFTFQTATATTWCAKAVGSKSGYTSGTGTKVFTT